MSEVSDLEQRLAAAEARLERVPATGPGVYGAPDPDTGERWSAGNVLGHLAEILEFWPGQVRAVLAGGTEVGRDAEANARRKAAIDAGPEVGEAELRRRIGSACDEVVALLGSMTEPDLNREITFHTRTGDRELTLGRFIEDLLVGHLEGHVDQLEQLSPGG